MAALTRYLPSDRPEGPFADRRGGEGICTPGLCRAELHPQGGASVTNRVGARPDQPSDGGVVSLEDGEGEGLGLEEGEGLGEGEGFGEGFGEGVGELLLM